MRHWFLAVILVAGVALIVGNLLLGLIKGRVFAPPSLVEIAATKTVRRYFLTRAEAPVRFWRIIAVHGAVTALLIYLVVIYILHPEVFR